jgi:hypothetical protein
MYKYRVQPGGKTNLKGWFTGVFAVGEQDGNLVIWAENSLTKSAPNQMPRAEDEKIEIEVFSIGTGWPYAAGGVGRHIGSVQMKDGLVWHVFIDEVPNNDNV